MAEENVVLVTFEEESKTYQAASALEEASARGRIELHAVAVAQRAEDGTLRIKEGDADDFPVASWAGGVIGGTTGGILGLTLGVLGGPLGLLLGGTGGALLGSLIDIDDADRAESVFSTMARAIGPNARRPSSRTSPSRPWRWSTRRWGAWAERSCAVRSTRWRRR